MMQENTNAQQEEAVRKLYEHAAQLMKAGWSNSRIEGHLVEQGLSQEAASIVVQNLSKMRDEARRKSAEKNMLHGALWCIGGILVTAISYSAASGGGSYIVTWGAIVFGTIQFFRGLYYYSKG